MGNMKNKPAADALCQAQPKLKKESMLKMTLFRLWRRPTAAFGLIVVGIIIILSICIPFISPYNYNDMDLFAIYDPPSLKHWCGTDGLGRDMLTRLLYAGRYSLGLGIVSSAFAVAAGTILGAISGYFGGRVDNLIMRICDVIQAIPGMLLAILISATLGNGLFNTILAISISGIPNILRLMRGQVLSIRTEEYLEAAQSINCSSPRIMFHHVLPNVMSPIIVNATMSIGNTINIAAGLSFIGLGVQPPTPEWGAMLTSGKDYLIKSPHLIIVPGIIMLITIMCFNFVGDGLRDALDPKLKEWAWKK